VNLINVVSWFEMETSVYNGLVPLSRLEQVPLSPLTSTTFTPSPLYYENMHINKSAYDCIIVGAGMSGLCCASRLAKCGHRVLVLEARARIGGRIHTESGPNNEPVDLGARYTPTCYSLIGDILI
jgi:NADPH-dependent 2,4-dienoyl-CoA reductase/sulfur reductase-like enzyme